MPFSEEKADKAVRFFQALTLSDGQWAGQRFRLIPWQADLVRRVFGTVQDDGYRQYRLVYVEIPKKNGKSGLAGGFALYLLAADDEPGAEVYGAAVDRKQASIVYDEAAKFVKKSRALRRRLRLRESTKVIAYPDKGAKYEVVSSEIDSKHGIKPHGIIFDEIHALKKRKLWDILTKGSTSARLQPLIIVITTAGDSKDGVAWELHLRAINKLRAMAEMRPGDPEPDPTFLPVVYGISEGEDWENEEVWKKANPSIGHTISMETVRNEYRDAKGKPIDEAYFRQLRLNQWGMPVVGRLIPVSYWDQTKDIPVDPERLKGRKCYGGLDLSSVSDLTAWLMLFEDTDDPEALDVLARLWVPEARLTDKQNPNQGLYQLWAYQKKLTVIPGEVIDYDFIRKQILEDSKQFALVDFNVDRDFQSHETIIKLTQEGLKPVPFGLGFRSMAMPMREFERRVKAGKFRHGGHPVLRWNFENLEVERDAAGNLKPSKKKDQHKKMDGIVALLMALERAMRHSLPKGPSGPVEVEINGRKITVW